MMEEFAILLLTYGGNHFTACNCIKSIPALNLHNVLCHI